MVCRLHLSVLLPCKWWGSIFLNDSNIEAVPNKRQPGDSPRTTKPNKSIWHLNARQTPLSEPHTRARPHPPTHTPVLIDYYPSKIASREMGTNLFPQITTQVRSILSHILIFISKAHLAMSFWRLENKCGLSDFFLFFFVCCLFSFCVCIYYPLFIYLSRTKQSNI